MYTVNSIHISLKISNIYGTLCVAKYGRNNWSLRENVLLEIKILYFSGVYKT